MQSNLFIADLHIHSKYSRATAKNLDLENIYIWSQLKGIQVVGTGDFTHPEWFAELCDKLEPAEAGFYRLKKSIEHRCDRHVPSSCRGKVRFMLSCEISNIYKKSGATRKNHNLVFFPTLDEVRRFNTRLDAIGNIKSDGRPIIGLDARDLLEIVLEVSENGFLVPAHIWTPWFSMLGSKSGFDSIEACFDDLSSYIFAAETGLSSDPSMNWRISNLDNLTLISNSDAHSPSKLGREANLFKSDFNYFDMRDAMQKGDGEKFLGTFEFYPEEGKYHADGHRKCEVCFSPAQTQAHDGKCPVCGKALTLGVLHRVEYLSTRPEGHQPERSFPFYRLIPLDDLLSHIYQVGPQSKKVKQAYHELLNRLGSEFNILHFLPIDKVETSGVPLLAEAIGRMRTNQVRFFPGFDGRFGTVQLFDAHERDLLAGQRGLFSGFDKKSFSIEASHGLSREPSLATTRRSGNLQSNRKKTAIIGLNEAQQAAVNHDKGHLMIIAGPGTGKTRTLTHKIAHLIRSGVDVAQILAVTFTKKAATEMEARLHDILGVSHPLPFVGTFHALGYQIVIRSMSKRPVVIIDERTRKSLVEDVLKLEGISSNVDCINAETLMQWIADAKQQLIPENGPLDGVCPREHRSIFRDCYHRYQQLLGINHAVDFEDLIFIPIQLIENDRRVRDYYAGRFGNIFIDEYQDINAAQYRLVKLISGEKSDICVIGDPDQSIYGFRGSDIGCFQWFKDDNPVTRTICLDRNYRSTQTILDVATQVIRANPETSATGHRRTVFTDVSGERTIQIIETASEKAEAVAIGKKIEAMLGGICFFSLDKGGIEDADTREALSFADFAVLYRTRGQKKVISSVLEKAGIPCQQIDIPSTLEHPGIKPVLALFKIAKGLGMVSDLSAACDLSRPSISDNILNILKIWSYQNHMDLEKALVQARRLPIPSMGRSRQQRLYEFIGQLMDIRSATDKKTVVETIEWFAAKLNLDEKFKDEHAFETGYRRLLQAAESHPTDPAGFMSEINLSNHTDMFDHGAERVSLMTMHAAKGLEFPVVFIAGCEEGWIPYRSARRPSSVEEERRLFYVAMTRAKRHLLLTKAGRRMINGQLKDRRWSSFIEEIESRYKTVFVQQKKTQQMPLQQQLSLFR